MTPIPMYACPWRRFVVSWFGYWLDPRTHWGALRDVYLRGRYGFAPSDTWSLDSYLTRWVPEALLYIRGSGYPSNMTLEEWDAVIDEMIDGFRAHAESEEMDDVPEDRAGMKAWFAVRDKRRMDGMRTFAQYFGHLWT